MSDDQRTEVLATLKELLLEEDHGLPPDRIGEGTSFQADLNFDSLEMMELLMALESRFGLEIPDEEAEGITTVGQAVDYILGRLAAPARG